MSEQDVRGVHAAGESAAYARRDHYHQNVLGQGAQAGDPQPAVSTLTPPETNMRDGDVSKGPASSL
jgi:hypothetical protein